MSISTFRFFAVLALIACACLPLGSQTTFGSITGTVTDQSEAVIPSVVVTVINDINGEQRRVTTQETGVFHIADLPVGSYRVRIESEGFRGQERTGVFLNANQVVNIDVQLAVAATETEVAVVGAAPVIDTETAALSNLKTSRELEQLPIVSRTGGAHGFFGYTLLNPGVSKVSGQNNPAVNGMRILDTTPTIDGIVVMAYADGIGGGPVQPSLEGIEQVNIQLASSGAEFARPGNFTVVTKSGGNQFHGGAFWDYNGSRLNARNFFATARPFRVYNNFAASLGGPIRKNKTFFFGDYEGSRESARVVLTGSTPLVPWRSGDFSGMKAITDPRTGQAFPGNMIPASRISPVSQKLQEFFYPLPNFGPPDLQSGNWRGQRFGQTQGYTRFDNFDTRVDHRFREQDTVYARVSYRRLPVLGWDNVLPPTGRYDEIRSSNSAVASWTHSFSPTLLNEFRAGMTRMRDFTQPGLIGRGILQQAGLQGIGITAPLRAQPIITVTGITTTDQSDSNVLNLNTNFQWTDNLSLTRGAHFLKFGADVIRDQLSNANLPNSIYGSYNFTGAYTGFGYADFLLGIPQTTSRAIPTPESYLRGVIWSFYAQDQFKVRRRLTLTYGVRWELQSPYHDKNSAQYSFDPLTGAVVVPDDALGRTNPLYPKSIPIIGAAKAGYPGSELVDFDETNIYPRVGFAFKPFSDEKTVVRGGYGIYGNTIYGAAGKALTGGPFSGSESFTNALTNGVPLFSFPQPFLTVGQTATQNVSGLNPHAHTPYSQQFNLTLERQVGQIGLRVAYVGTRSLGLIYLRNLNEPPPSTIPFSNGRRFYPIYNTVNWYDNGGSQQYNSLQVSASKTYGKNLFFNTGWTWAKDLTDTQNTGASFSGPVIQNQFDRVSERGDNILDRTHRLYGNVIYTLPAGRGQRFLGNVPSVVNGILGGWSVSWVVVAQAGQFFTPSFTGSDPSNTNTVGGRPDRIGSAKLSSGQSINQWFNAAAFKVPGCPDADPICKSPANIGRFGNSGVNVLRGPSTKNVDFSSMKTLQITEGKRLLFRVMMTNAFNHPNFSNPAANISAPGTVGRISTTFNEQLGEDQRWIHFSLRFQF
jgi:hypothetical protein